MPDTQEPRWKKRVAITGAVCMVIGTTFGIIQHFWPEPEKEVARIVVPPQLSEEDIQRLKSLTAEDKVSALDLYERAYSHFLLGEYVEALSGFDSVIRMTPRLAAAHAAKGIVLFQLGRNDEAELSLQAALLYQQNSMWRVFLAEVQQATGQWHAADQLFLSLLSGELEPIVECAARRKRGRGLRMLGQPADALEELDRSLILLDTLPVELAASSTRAEIQMDRAQALADLKRAGEAQEALKAAARYAKPDDPNFFDQQGLVLLKLDRVSEAVEAFKKADSLAPEDAVVLYNLACAYSRLGNGEQATAVLARSLKLDASLRASARTDSDFDFLRSRYAREFLELTAE